MYKAIEEIGGYKIGEEVPEEKALAWLNMYIKPCVKKVGSSDEKVVVKEPGKSEKEEPSNDFMLEDYLGRNTDVVTKNITEDNLSKEQLDSLLLLEQSGKKRRDVIKAINKKLK